MGIRYYAYVFEAELTELALTDPRAFIGEDPLADAWGMEPGARISVMTGVQALPSTEMLYLDKAWSELQALTAPGRPGAPPRPAYRMFEGRVTMSAMGWTPWVRALAPDAVGEIAADLPQLHRSVRDEVSDYVLEYLERAVEFAAHAASARRGFAYMIG